MPDNEAMKIAYRKDASIVTCNGEHFEKEKYKRLICLKSGKPAEELVKEIICLISNHESIKTKIR